MASELKEKSHNSVEPVQALERFVLDSADLMRLEELVGPFNIFEAVGIVRQETRHSNYLAWLLDPGAAHGLGDLFLKNLLMLTSSRARSAGIDTVSPIDVDVWDLAEVQVRREWHNIDIAIVDERNKFICSIENKIHSSEHSDQLRRYRKIVETLHPDWKRHFIFLTATDDQPSDAEHYVRITYHDICQAIEHVLRLKGNALSGDLKIALSHYITMVRRRIMPDQELQKLCRRIYSKHKQALDLILEYRPDLQSDLRDALIRMIDEEEGFVLDSSSKQWIRFLPQEWDTDKLRRGDGRWTPSRRMLMLQFNNRQDALSLTVHLGPGDTGVREEIFKIALTGPPFRPSQKTLPGMWLQMYDRSLLRSADYEEPDIERMMSRVKALWAEIKAQDLVRIQAALRPTLV